MHMSSLYVCMDGCVYVCKYVCEVNAKKHTSMHRLYLVQHSDHYHLAAMFCNLLIGTFLQINARGNGPFGTDRQQCTV